MSAGPAATASSDTYLPVSSRAGRPQSGESRELAAPTELHFRSAGDPGRKSVLGVGSSRS